MWSPVILVLGIVASCTHLTSCHNNTESYALLRLIPTEDQHLEALQDFSDPDDAVLVLRRSREHSDPFDVLVPQHKRNFVHEFAKAHGIQYGVKDDDYVNSLQTDGTLKEADRRSGQRKYSGFNPFTYKSFQAINDYLDLVQSQHPNMVKLEPLGKSYEGRQLRLVRISSDHGAGNPVIFIDAGIHAREWVAPAMALYLIHRLTSDERSRHHELNGVDWYILPVVNPDGYEYTRTSPVNRLWRKTRSQHGVCYGVDGNRNYGFRWGVSGVSSNPCNRETYAGPAPFSEPETQYVRNVMINNADRIKLYVSLHAYGQYLVYPWGYTRDALPKTWRKLDMLARKVSTAVVEAGGQPFRVLSAGKWYPAAGGSDDFAFGAVGIPYSYTMELTDSYEFKFPENLLHKVLPQFYEGFREFGVQIANEFPAPIRIGRRKESSQEYELYDK